MQAGWSVREEAELLFFDPIGHGGARDTKGARKTAQTAAFLIGVQDLFAAVFWVDVGSRILAAATPTGVTAILLFPVRGMPVAHESLTATMRTVKGDGDQGVLLFFISTMSSESTISFSLVPLSG